MPVETATCAPYRQVFLQKNLTVCAAMPYFIGMSRELTKNDSNVASCLRADIEKGGERVWSFDDFKCYSTTAVAKELSRLVKQGKLQRLSKGIYYSAKNTSFGKSRPNPVDLKKLAFRKNKFFPSGIVAANILGLTTQNPLNAEISTSSQSLPRKLVGDNTIVYSRRPKAWEKLSDKEAAILDFLRGKALASELEKKELFKKLLKILSKDDTYENLIKVASSEPPRVRAMLGALGEGLNKPKKVLDKLKSGLNPLSKFDFGNLTSLPNADNWQAKKVK